MKMLLMSGLVFLCGLMTGLILAALGFWIWVQAEPAKIPVPPHTGSVNLHLADPDAGEQLEKPCPREEPSKYSAPSHQDSEKLRKSR